jgi:3-hydroxyacyl-CoA dehydrogenase
VPEGLRKIAEERGRVYPAEPKAPPARVLSLAWQRRQGKVVRENLNARLVDLGDQVLCCELTPRWSRHEPVDDYMMAMMEQAHEEVGSGRFKALVVSNQAANFCAGAQLNAVLELARAGGGQVERMAATLQRINLRNLHASFPVVVAPHGLTLRRPGDRAGRPGARGGGGAVRGAVEVGVGVVPAGGGATCAAAARQQDGQGQPRPEPPVMAAFDLIGSARSRPPPSTRRRRGCWPRPT